MAADGSGTLNGFSISGITGSYPIITKLELYHSKYGVESKAGEWEISDNNPNLSVSGLSYVYDNVNMSWIFRWYDADGNVVLEHKE